MKPHGECVVPDNPLERVGYLVQVAIPLPHRLPHALHRSSMDLLRAQVSLQHRLQNCLHQHIGVYCVPNA